MVERERATMPLVGGGNSGLQVPAVHEKKFSWLVGGDESPERPTRGGGGQGDLGASSLAGLSL